MRRSRRSFGVLAVLVPTCLGCVHLPVVERAYGGNVVDGHYVSPEAYAAFLRGAMAEAASHPADALREYAEAAAQDPASPEPWTRIAQVHCTTGGREGAAEGELAIEHALALDPLYARAWSVRATCAVVRGDTLAERAAARRAAQLDPQGDGANILLAQADDAWPGQVGLREALIALTVTAAEPVAAWTALASWAEAHGDVALWTRALVELARVSPAKRPAIARSAEELAGNGNVGEARLVAGGLVDASEGPLPAELALVVRLALDEAIVRRDVDAVRRRATRGRLALDEAGGRALLGGERALAHDLVAAAAMADPGALGARLVLAVADGRDLLGPAIAPRPTDTPVSPAALVAFGAALLHAAPSAAPPAIAAIPRLPLLAGDDRVVRATVELASCGVLVSDVLPPDGALELSVILGQDSVRAASDEGPLDARHRYLAVALARPNSARARELAHQLRAVVATDPIVAAASALVQLADGTRISADAPHALLARNPADPLLAATALRLAEKVGDAEVARRARATLAALTASRHSF